MAVLKKGGIRSVFFCSLIIIIILQAQPSLLQRGGRCLNKGDALWCINCSLLLLFMSFCMHRNEKRVGRGKKWLTEACSFFVCGWWEETATPSHMGEEMNFFCYYCILWACGASFDCFLGGVIFIVVFCCYCFLMMIFFDVVWYWWIN